MAAPVQDCRAGVAEWELDGASLGSGHLWLNSLLETRSQTDTQPSTSALEISASLGEYRLSTHPCGTDLLHLQLFHLLRVHGILAPQSSQEGRMLYVKDAGKELGCSSLKGEEENKT